MEDVLRGGEYERFLQPITPGMPSCKETFDGSCASGACCTASPPLRTILLSPRTGVPVMHSLPPLPLSSAAAAWSTLAILSGLNMLNYLDRYVMSAVLTPMQKELRLDDGAAGSVASAFMLGYFLSAPLFGYLGDRFPRKYLMLGGVLIWSLATAGSGLANSFAQLFAIRMVVGVGEACFVTMGPSWISDLFAATRRNTALTLFYVAIPFGSAIGFTIGGWFTQQGDWRARIYLRRTARCPARAEPVAAPGTAPGRSRTASEGEVRSQGSRRRWWEIVGLSAQSPLLQPARLGLVRCRPSPSALSGYGGRRFSIAFTACPWANRRRFLESCSPEPGSSRRCSAVFWPMP